MEKPTRRTRTAVTTLQPAFNSDLLGATNFNGLLIDSIIEGMSEVLKSNGTTSFLFHSRLRSHGVDSRKFHSHMAALMGPAADTVEKVIVRKLYERLGLPSGSEDVNFEKYVNLARTVFRTRAKEVDLI